jgi:hypothetical protein
MGIRKRFRSRIKSIGAQQGIIGLRRCRLDIPEASWRAPLTPGRRTVWRSECDREIGRLLAWEQRMGTRPHRKRRRHVNNKDIADRA